MSAMDVVVMGLQAAESDALKQGAVPGYTLMAHGALEGLKYAGYAVVELPKQCKIPDEWTGCLGAWSTTSAVEPVSAWPKRYVVTPDDTWLSIEDARSLAAALLAAADVAEVTS